ncbi:MAG: DUF3164 family protein [Pontibacterium sp.]
MNEQPVVQPHIPEGYMMNAAGHLVPADQVREQDLLRDSLVSELAPEALRLHEALCGFKKKALEDIDDLVAIAGERYGTKLGGRKGNVSLTTFDGRFKVQRSFREVVGFTEEIEAAKELIDQCLNRWTEGANQNVRAIVSQAFRTNTKGEIKTGKVLELMRLDIKDDEWQLAMTALKDALQNIGTAVYVRVYERIGMTDQYRPIPLDLAAV